MGFLQPSLVGPCFLHPTFFLRLTFCSSPQPQPQYVSSPYFSSPYILCFLYPTALVSSYSDCLTFLFSFTLLCVDSPSSFLHLTLFSSPHSSLSYSNYFVFCSSSHLPHSSSPLSVFFTILFSSPDFLLCVIQLPGFLNLTLFSSPSFFHSFQPVFTPHFLFILLGFLYLPFFGGHLTLLSSPCLLIFTLLCFLGLTLMFFVLLTFFRLSHSALFTSHLIHFSWSLLCLFILLRFLHPTLVLPSCSVFFTPRFFVPSYSVFPPPPPPNLFLLPPFTAFFNFLLFFPFSSPYLQMLFAF